MIASEMTKAAAGFFSCDLLSKVINVQKRRWQVSQRLFCVEKK